MPHLLRSQSAGHLMRRTHLRLKHPGYTIGSPTSVAWGGDYGKDVEHDTEKNSPDYGEFPGVVSAAIASMSSGGRPNTLSVSDIWGGAGMGYYHYVSASVCAIGYIRAVTANGGAPFGSPLADISVSISGGISPLVRVGTGSTPPGGNPKDWGGAAVSTSSTLGDVSIGGYVWYSVWVVVPGSYSSNPYTDIPSASISLSNIRFQPA